MSAQSDNPFLGPVVPMPAHVMPGAAVAAPGPVPGRGPAEARPEAVGGADATPAGWFAGEPPIARTLALATEARELVQGIVREIDTRAERLCALARNLENDPMAQAAGWDAGKARAFLEHLAEARRAI